MDIKDLKEKIKQNYNYFILLGIVIASFIYMFIIFSLYPYSYGVDGAYYDLQVNNILETGEMWVGDNPFSFYFFAFLVYLIPGPTLAIRIMLAIKLGVIIFCCLIPIPIYLILRKLTRNEIAALFGAIISTFNPMLFRLMGDFVKNSIGTFFLLCFIYLFLKCCEKQENTKKTLALFSLTFGMFILMIFTHIYPTGFAVGFIFIYFIYAVLYNLITERKLPYNEIKIVIFLIISVGVSIFLIYYLQPDFFEHFLKIEDFINAILGTSVQFGYEVGSILTITLQQLPPMNPMQNMIYPILEGISVIGIIIIIYDLFKKKSLNPILQYIALNLALFLLVYLVVPNLSELPAAFMTPDNLIVDFLGFLTCFPVCAGISLVIFEIYKNDPDKFNMNRHKGLLLAIFLMSAFLQALTFISPTLMQWTSRFSYMNFITIALLAGFSIKTLKKEKRKRTFAIILIIFFTSSSFIQTSYFNYFQTKPVINPQGVNDLKFLGTYVAGNSSLNGSIVCCTDLGLYYWTIYSSGLEAQLIGSPFINTTYYAEYYNETIFIIQESKGDPPKPGQEIINDHIINRFYDLVLANYTFNYPD